MNSTGVMTLVVPLDAWSGPVVLVGTLGSRGRPLLPSHDCCGPRCSRPTDDLRLHEAYRRGTRTSAGATTSGGYAQPPARGPPTGDRAGAAAVAGGPVVDRRDGARVGDRVP